MGGEWSKAVGEHGEAVGEVLLKKLGWGSFQKGVSIDCIRPKPHALANSSARQNHGIDFLFSYKSPLCDDLCDNLIISSKYTSNPYPTSPASIFKGYCAELAYTIHCFEKSNTYIEQVKKFPGCDKRRNIGILLWLSNESGSTDLKEILCKTDTLKVDDRYEAIYLVENNTAEFLYDSITHVENLDQNSEVTFVYIETGKYTNPATRRYDGSILPFEYTNLGILPLKSVVNGNSTLSISCADPFSEESLGRLIGLAQSISQNWATRIRILFPDYNSLNHENITRSIMSSFSEKDITDKIEIGCFRPKLQQG